MARSGSLRAATARGGVLNAGFLSAAELLVLLQGLLATALLGPDAIGLYGIVTTTAMTIVALRRVGIDEAFVAQAAEHEEAEFQRAFGVELAIGLAGSLLIAALAPVLAGVYDDDRLLALTLGVAYLPVAFALQAPQWIFFRRMDYLRLRLLQAIVPLGTVAVAVPLLLAGVGVWALVIGPLCGHAAAVLAAAWASPYRLRPRFERPAARRYLRFSWPVFVTAVATLLVAQGQIAVFGLSDDGLAAAGWITLAATLTRYADRADQIVATTIYPAIVRVRDRVDVLEELFAKTNRLTLMWAFPFGAGLVLFGARPGAVPARRRVGAGGGAARRPGGGDGAPAAGLQLVLVLPGARRAGAAGGRVGGLRGVVRGAGGAGRAGGRELGLRRRAARVHGLRAGDPAPVRRAAAARGAAGGAGLAGGAAGGGRVAAGGGRAARAVGRRAAARAGAGGAGAVARRARAGHPPARGGAASGAVGLPARRRRAPGRDGGRVSERPPLWRRWPGLLLWLAAALISGFTIWRGLEPFDEGFLLQAATRMADGQWPYGDFGWPYGPGQPLLVAAAFDAFEPSVLWWRLLRVAADASIAVIVWALVRPAAGERWALAGWLAAAVTIAQPTTANPFAAALAFGLGAVLAAARGRAVAAGLLVALAAFWRPDIGALAGLAALAAAAADPGALAAAADRGAARRAGAVAAAALVAAAVLYAPFAVAAGPAELWDSLVAEAARDGSWWRLPFPFSYDGPLRGWPPDALAEDLKDVLGYYLPAIGLAGAAGLGALLIAARWRPGAAGVGLLVLTAGSLVYLSSRPDELHVQPLLVCLCALLPMAAATGADRRPASRSRACSA